MKHIEISHQKAAVICKQEGIPFLELRNGPWLLKTGAKIYRRVDTHTYHIGGYAYDGSDVTPYEKKE